MKDRILEIIRHKQMNNADFATKINVSPATISAVLNGRNNPSLDLVTKIHQVFPDISLSWLLDGVGEMYETCSGAISQPCLFDENGEISANGAIDSEYCKENRGIGPENTPKETIRQEIRYIEKPQRKITEIRIFFDDNTYEIFKPDK